MTIILVNKFVSAISFYKLHIFQNRRTSLGPIVKDYEDLVLASSAFPPEDFD
jgi:hypothetical protein